MNKDLKASATALNDDDLEEVSGGLTLTIGASLDEEINIGMADLPTENLHIEGEEPLSRAQSLIREYETKRLLDAIDKQWEGSGKEKPTRNFGVGSIKF